MKQYFKTAKPYDEMLSDVWTWTEFPYREGQPDTGIDLVAKTRDTNDFWAIQCKFYSEKYSVTKDDVDTFLSASGKSFKVEGIDTRYSNRIVVSTTDKWSSNAENTIIGQIPKVTRIGLNELINSSVDWNSFTLDNISAMRNMAQKELRPHQVEALKAVTEGFKSADRGKLIMACGTGKTFTSLKIAEKMLKDAETEEKSVLFLVPSISLLNQTLTEWSVQCKLPYNVYAICSDPKASKNAEVSKTDSIDVTIPATTDVDVLYRQYMSSETDRVNLFFSTYQSIQVIHDLQDRVNEQKNEQLSIVNSDRKLIFNLIICDEAHRTTGVTLSDEDESNFVKVHDSDYIKGEKRLYMTATPRIYGDASKSKAKNINAELCSMDDEDIYGKELYTLGFSRAVEEGLLTDYKVIVLAVDENYVSRSLQKMITDKNNELTLDDSVKIIGCLNGLSKKTLYESDKESFKNDIVF